MGTTGWRGLLVGASAALVSLGAGALPANAGAAPSVLLVGDSLAVMTAPYLERYLPGVRLTVNAENGYNSFQILDLFEEAYDPTHTVIVFDAGTNDNPAYPEILAGNLDAAVARLGNRCMVVPTVHGYTVDGVDNTGKNQVVRSFAASRPGTQVPDWAGFVASHPELMQADGLHPTPEGTDARARLLAAGVQGCIGHASASAASQGPELERAPQLPQVHDLGRRQASILAAIGIGLARELMVGIAGRQAPISALVAAVSTGLADA